MLDSLIAWAIGPRPVERLKKQGFPVITSPRRPVSASTTSRSRFDHVQQVDVAALADGSCFAAQSCCPAAGRCLRQRSVPPRPTRTRPDVQPTTCPHPPHPLPLRAWTRRQDLPRRSPVKRWFLGVPSRLRIRKSSAIWAISPMPSPRPGLSARGIRPCPSSRTGPLGDLSHRDHACDRELPVTPDIGVHTTLVSASLTATRTAFPTPSLAPSSTASRQTAVRSGAISSGRAGAS